MRAPLPPVGVPGVPGFVGGGREGGDVLLPGFGGGIPPGALPPGLPVLGMPQPGGFHGLPADPLAGALFMPPPNSKDRVRQEIIEITHGNQALQNHWLTRLKEMSEDQALRSAMDDKGSESPRAMDEAIMTALSG